MFKTIPRNVFILGLVSFFNDVASEMIYPIVPIFLTSVLQAPVSIVGLIEGISEATASSTKFLFGYLSDRMGKRKFFVTSGYTFATISKLLIALASSWYFVLFARFIDRFGKGLRTSPRDALLLQSATSSNKGFIFGFHRSLDSFGAVVGPLLALLSLSFFKNDMRLIFLLAFIPASIGVVLLILFVKEKMKKNCSKKEKQSFSFSLRSIHKNLLFFFIVSMIFALGNSSDAFLILRSKDLGLTTTLTVLAYVLYNVSQTLFAAPAGSFADFIGAKKVYTLGLLIFSFVYFVFAVAQNSVLMWVIFPIYGLYIAFTDGISKAYISEFITKKEAATYFGLYQTGVAVASFFASFIGGLLWTFMHPSATFYYGSFMAFLSFALLIWGSNKYSSNQEKLSRAQQT